MRTTLGRRMIGWIGVGLLGCCGPLWAQAQIGDQWGLNLGGSIGAGYSGSLTNEGPSSHGITFGGNADLSGYYHSSQFLSFSAVPFYNQSRNDSNYQSITDSSGVTASTAIFGGSKFPGYVNYTKTYNGEGNYSLPGVANYRTNTDGQSIGVGWSFTPTDALALSVGYQDGSSNYSIYGTNGENSSHFQSVFATANYNFAGFRLGGGYHYTSAGNTLAETVTGQATESSSAASTTYNFSLSHALALDGTTWLNYARNTTGFNTLGESESQTSDVVSGGAALKPLHKLSVQFSADYDNNLAGAVYQAEASAGVLTPLTLPGERSHSWGLFGQAQYNVTDEFYFTGYTEHRQQFFLGTAYDSTSYGGGITYGRNLWGGQFTTSTIFSDSSLGTSDESRLGVLSNAIYIRQVGSWNVSGSAGYSRNVQTILVAYTTSGYSFSGTANRRIGRLIWTGGAGASKSAMTQVEGANSMAQNYTTGLASRRVGVSAGYARSSGMGLYTAQGITTLPTGLPPTLLPSSVLYGATSYSAGVGGTPIRGLTFSGNFAKVRSNTENGSLTSHNNTEEANAYLQYRFRKVNIVAGYSRLVQGFSASSLAPAMVSTYYVGLSRWFNFF